MTGYVEGQVKRPGTFLEMRARLHVGSEYGTSSSQFLQMVAGRNDPERGNMNKRLITILALALGAVLVPSSAIAQQIVNPNLITLMHTFDVNPPSAPRSVLQGPVLAIRSGAVCLTLPPVAVAEI